MNNIIKLDAILEPAKKGRFAVGSFSPRYTKLIRPVIEAAQNTASPAIVQISHKEIERHQVDVEVFAEAFYNTCEELGATVPLCLHLDHTKDFEIIRRAIGCRFTSVMIDASEYEFSKNVELTRQVVEYAHAHNVSVEAELGKIGTTDFVETDRDEELYTVPAEAQEFCRLTNVDALAVSVGTAHGVYTIRQPKIDYGCLAAINSLVETPLVLHGGSGVPSAMVSKAVLLPSGGVSKVNIATDLELAMLKVAGRTGHLTEAELNTFGDEEMKNIEDAVRALVEDRMEHYLLCAGKAALYQTARQGANL